ncbi:hypothetical protein Tco_1568983 [Tanacetum coccineum]
MAEVDIDTLIMEQYLALTRENQARGVVGCRICEGAHLDKDYPLNEEVKRVEEFKYGEVGRTYLNNGGNRYRVGLPGYYTRVDGRSPFGKRKPSLEELMNKHIEESTRRRNENEEWMKKLQETMDMNIRNQNVALKDPRAQVQFGGRKGKRMMVESGMAALRLFGGQKGKTKMVESGTAALRLDSCKPIRMMGNDTCKFWLMCDPNLKECNGGDSVYGLDEQGVLKKWYYYHDNEIRVIKEKEVLVSDFLQIRYGNNKIDDTTRARRPRDYSFKEWFKVKIGHTNVNKFVKNAVLNEWILDSFYVESNSSGMSNDPYSRDLEECKLVFDNEIAQLANEYELRIGKRGTSCTTYAKNVNKYMGERCTHGTTKDLRKKNDGRVMLDDDLPLGRANGSRFKGMIRKEMDTAGSVQKEMLLQQREMRTTSPRLLDK